MAEKMKKNARSDYMQRQMHILSSIGLFYLIIIALFGIPLLATFVVVLMQGVFDFRYVILGAGVIIAGLTIYYLGRFGHRLFQKIRRDGVMAISQARERASRGETVQLQLLGGLFSLSYAGTGANTLPESLSYGGRSPALIEDMRKEQAVHHDPIEQLKDLSALKEKGVINEYEFQRLKEKLIQNVCDM